MSTRKANRLSAIPTRTHLTADRSPVARNDRAWGGGGVPRWVIGIPPEKNVSVSRWPKQHTHADMIAAGCEQC
jgi:hypothetical protein